jgi:hypothetical protein
MDLKDIKSHWNGIKKGDAVKLIRDVYQRLDGSPYGGIYYEPPGHMIAKRGTIGRFSGKTPRGILVYLNNGVGSVLGLVLDEFAIEKHNGLVLG